MGAWLLSRLRCLVGFCAAGVAGCLALAGSPARGRGRDGAAPSGQAAGSVRWGGQCWLPVGFLPVMESPEATGWTGEGRLGELCLLDGKGASDQAILVTGTPFQIPFTCAANSILGEAGMGG